MLPRKVFARSIKDWVTNLSGMKWGILDPASEQMGRLGEGLS